MHEKSDAVIFDMYQKIISSFFLVWLSAQSVAQLYKILFLPDSRGVTVSAKWDTVFILLSLYTFLFMIGNLLFLWKDGLLGKITYPFKGKNKIFTLRKRLGYWRYLLTFLLVLLPICFFQYSLWGLIFRGIYLRIFVWLNLVYWLAFFLEDGDEQLGSWSSLFKAVIFSSTAFGLASVFSNIVSYPFGLYWSEGNRIWDYSLIFGRHLYDYPAEQEIPSLTSFGRQILWGLPFSLSNNTIWLSRLWSALLYSLPSVILGWLLFTTENGKRRYALLLGLWSFLFLNQGPIYTPLILSAILVVLAWNRSLWLAAPLIVFGGYYAQVSRYTWTFAPAIWAGMLSLNGSKLKGTCPALRDWGRAMLLGIFGSIPWLLSAALSQRLSADIVLQGDAYKQNIFSRVLSLLEEQPLLWERLLPNPTYPEGVLGALLLAVLPVSVLLFFLYRRGVWLPSRGQQVAIWLPLLVFLAAGIVASTKIGGGNNLHNLDMFLITLLFVAAIAWRNGGSSLFEHLDFEPAFVKTALLLAFVLPAFPALRSLRPLLALNDAEIKRVQVFTGEDVVESLPVQDDVNDALWAIDRAVRKYESVGDVLFIDQRQLLTFGQVPRIPLVAEYEKKVLMNEALAANSEYFQGYYQDLAMQRFSLIISEPLKVPSVARDEASFAQEGDAWTVWVAAPTLCFYEPLFTLKDVYVQALVPREDVQGCEVYLDE